MSVKAGTRFLRLSLNIRLSGQDVGLTALAPAYRSMVHRLGKYIENDHPGDDQ
jgi:hypothetical protein